MAWKNAEFDFHAVELFAPQGETTTPPREGAEAPAAPGGKTGQVLAPGVKTMGVVARRSSGSREAAFEIFAARRISE